MIVQLRCKYTRTFTSDIIPNYWPGYTTVWKHLCT